MAMMPANPLLFVTSDTVPARKPQGIRRPRKVETRRAKLRIRGDREPGRNLVTELFARTAGITMQHIPYRGGAPAVTSLLTGDTQFAVLSPQVSLPQIETGKMRALAAGGLARDPQFPNIPTIAEQGYPDFEAFQWVGLLAPKGMPAGAVEKLNAQINRVIQTPDMIVKFAQLGMSPAGGTPEKFQSVIVQEIRVWTEVASAPRISKIHSQPAQSCNWTMWEITRHERTDIGLDRRPAALTFVAAVRALAAIAWRRNTPPGSSRSSYLIPPVAGSMCSHACWQSRSQNGSESPSSSITDRAAARRSARPTSPMPRRTATRSCSARARRLRSPFRSIRSYLRPAARLRSVALVANAPFLLVVNPTLNVGSVGELVTLAKNTPAKLSYGSAGPGSPQHLSMELLKSITGMELVHIPYKGDAPAITDLLAGHIPMQFAEATPALPLMPAEKSTLWASPRQHAFPTRPTFRHWPRPAHPALISCRGK